jgi:hypothetical protein
MRIYSDKLAPSDIHAATRDLPGVYLELHGPFNARKRSMRYVAKLSADQGTDPFGTKRRWANSGRWGACTPDMGYVGEPLGDKAATFDEWGVFIAELFARDPGAIVGVYDSPAELDAAWTDPRKVLA